MESFATGLKRIKDACDKAECMTEFETPDDGFVVVFYRHGTKKLSGTAQNTAQNTAQKEERFHALLEYCKEPRDRDEMMKFLGIKHRTTFRSDYLNPLLDEGKIAMKIPARPDRKCMLSKVPFPMENAGHEGISRIPCTSCTGK